MWDGKRLGLVTGSSSEHYLRGFLYLTENYWIRMQISNSNLMDYTNNGIARPYGCPKKEGIWELTLHFGACHWDHSRYMLIWLSHETSGPTTTLTSSWVYRQDMHIVGLRTTLTFTCLYFQFKCWSLISAGFDRSCSMIKYWNSFFFLKHAWPTNKHRWWCMVGLPVNMDYLMVVILV